MLTTDGDKWYNLTMDSQDKKFYSIREVAIMTGKSKTTIRRWMSRNYNPIPFKNFASSEKPSWMIAKEDLAEWIKFLPDPRREVMMSASTR